MPPFSFRQLQFVVALLDYPTLTSAAKSVHISESALSHGLRELEASVGEQLCIRRKAKGISLTPTGRHFAERARDLLRGADALAGSLGAVSGAPVGPVSLGCYAGLASNVLPAILEGMMAIHPGIHIDITVGDHAELLPRLAAGALDTAIVYDIDLPVGLDRQMIYPTEGMAVLAANDPLAKQEDIDLGELASKPLILLDTAPSKNFTTLAFEQRGLTPRIGAIVPHIDLVRALVGRGLGYGILMSRPNQIPASNEGLKLVTRRLKPRSGQTSVVAVWPQTAPLTSRARVVVDYAVSVFGPSATNSVT
jgi:DNA-binding transcriptional LysR family regulator